MTRQDALSGLNKNLLARQKRLGKKLAGELAYLYDGPAAAVSDSADLAFEADGDEISSRLAELGDRELAKIERALVRWKQGMYGICASCHKPISLARLNALPYTLFCIHCEREMEKSPDGYARQSKGNWGQISDGQAPMRDERINLAELERDLSGSRRG